MKTIQYVGTADFKEFSAADFTKAGVGGAKKTVFANRVPIEVDDAVADALLAAEGVLVGETFEEVQVENSDPASPEEGFADPADSPAPDISAAADSGTITENTGGPADPPTRTSTRTRP